MSKFDNRLTLTNGVNYRMWHDGYPLLLRKGESTTKPLMTEIVGVDSHAYSDIYRGYFSAPRVKFWNGLKPYGWFDEFRIPITRSIDDKSLRDGAQLTADLGVISATAKLEIAISYVDDTTHDYGVVFTLADDEVYFGSVQARQALTADIAAYDCEIGIFLLSAGYGLSPDLADKWFLNSELLTEISLQHGLTARIYMRNFVYRAPLGDYYVKFSEAGASVIVEPELSEIRLLCA